LPDRAKGLLFLADERNHGITNHAPPMLHSVGHPPSLLFLCVANSARSQMAEGLARQFSLQRRAEVRLHLEALSVEPGWRA